MGTHALEQVELAGERGRASSRPAPVVWRVVREVVLLATLFGVYSAGRQFAGKHTGSAFDHAREVLSFQRWMHLPDEATIQHAALQVPHVIEGANLYYASVHAPLTGAVLLWLSIWRPKAYPAVRWTMVSLTGLALIGHMVFPLAPPRMMPGFVDTGLRFGQSVYGPDNSSGVANQFAAMPSLHVGWAALIALSMILITRTKWRWLWLLHPIITFGVVVVTANHYWLDGIVVLILLAISLPLLLRPGLHSDTPRAKVRGRSRGRDGDGDNSVSPELALK
ncbi:phosphatase PAP2 family protein [Kribbella sp. VKM Ac-2568]|uniref:phosphatase PAP2 family protein n=1 Tax=Kribbella sp. VKM Ac-2568 TaxID=2512219 RepID=UPI00104835DC|nr:phosphatase PAP2 family protein [Kribbella sp. VKM Ac-2568]TCM41792.1 PAP2 superfamily protein [Kribbella sp. VKM Ac-2568]